MKIYQTNIDKYARSTQYLEKALKRLSLLRAISFIVTLVAISILANEKLLIFIWIAVPLGIIGFVFLLVRYNKVNNLKKTANYLKQINEEELFKLEYNLESFQPGQSYLKKDHPYIADLDVFGSHSLFQLLNRTTTESGSILLASWLAEPAPTELILERQQAIQELKTNLEWRQKLQVAGLPFKNSESDYQKLLKWLRKGSELLPNQSRYLIGSITLAVSSTLLAVLYVINCFSEGWGLYWIPLLLVLMLNYFILRRVGPIAEDIIDCTHDNIKILGGYEKLAQTIISEKFASEKLKRLRSELDKHESSAVNEIRKLKKILEAFQLRGTRRSDSNKFYAIFNVFWLLDIYYIIMTEGWKTKNRSHIEGWIRGISEFEVLNSLSGFAYSNPEFIFPAIRKEPYSINFEMLGHPLIKSGSRICNDFKLQGRGQIAMITGSNMAGKSTFLRTVGVNLILALMGAPCCAKSGKVSQLKLFTSMRTQDNLVEGISSFYAELRKVEQLLKLIKSGQPIFFMLDEMFKGTNSQDRYKGGVSLIKQLSELNAFGIIATHDLELAEYAGKHMIVSNHSFNSKISNGEMSFNYELSEGICTDFNATELMKKSGINIISDTEKLS